jgi:hypothetical protein
MYSSMNGGLCFQCHSASELLGGSGTSVAASFGECGKESVGHSGGVRAYRKVGQSVTQL